MAGGQRDTHRVAAPLRYRRHVLILVPSTLAKAAFEVLDSNRSYGDVCEVAFRHCALPALDLEDVAAISEKSSTACE